MISFTKNNLSSTESVDIIEKIVYEYLKPLGFRKHGRTLHRFVDSDISQVVNFQNGCPAKGVFDILWVNLGIRVPECVERKFISSATPKRYYHEYECNIRTRLGELIDGKDTFYNLKNSPEKIGEDIVKKLKNRVVPVFDTLNNRETILEQRRKYSDFDSMNNHIILLEEAMIYGRKGDIPEATRLFNEYYRERLAEYNTGLENGTKHYLRKGEKLIYRNARTNQTETIVAEKNGYVTLYDANDSHLRYLKDLANELGIAIEK